MENFDNWIFVNPETYVEDEVNFALDNILKEYSTFIELDSNISVLAYSEREKTKKFFEKVMDQSVYFNPDSLKLRRLLVDWYAAHKTKITKARNSTDLNILTNEELNEFMLSFGFPYPRNIISRGNRIQFLSNLINNYKKKGTSEAIANIVSLYGLRNVNISEWWIRYDSRREKPYFARSNVIHPENLRSEPSLEIERSYEDFIKDNPHWQITYDELDNLFKYGDNGTPNKITLPSITNVISIETHSNLTELELACSVFQRKVNETLDFWINYSLIPIKKPGLADYTIVTSMFNEPPSQEYLSADNPWIYENYNINGHQNVYLVGSNPSGDWAEFARKLVKYNYNTTSWSIVDTTSGNWSLFLRDDSIVYGNSLLIYNRETDSWDVYGRFSKDAVLNVSSNNLSTTYNWKYTQVFNGTEWVDLKRLINKKYFLNRNENIFRDIPLNNFQTLYSVMEIMLAFSYLHDGEHGTSGLNRHIYYNGSYSPLDPGYMETWSSAPPLRNDIDTLFYKDNGYEDIAIEYRNLVFDEDKLTPDNSITTFRHNTKNLNTPKLLQEAKKKEFYTKFTKRNNYIEARFNLHSQRFAENYLKAINPEFLEQIDLLVAAESKQLVLENMMIDFENYVMNTMMLIRSPFAYIQAGGQFFNRKLLPVLDFFKPFRVRLLDFLTKFDVYNPLMDSMLGDAEIENFHIDQVVVEKPFTRNIDTTSTVMYVSDTDIPVLDYKLGHGLATDDWFSLDIVHTVNEPVYSPLDRDTKYSSLDLSITDAVFITVTEGGDEIYSYKITDDLIVNEDVDTGEETDILPEEEE